MSCNHICSFVEHLSEQYRKAVFYGCGDSFLLGNLVSITVHFGITDITSH